MDIVELLRSEGDLVASAEIERLRQHVSELRKALLDISQPEIIYVGSMPEPVRIAREALTRIQEGEMKMTNERLIALFDYYGVDSKDELIAYLHAQLTHMRTVHPIVDPQIEADSQAKARAIAEDNNVRRTSPYV